MVLTKADPRIDARVQKFVALSQAAATAASYTDNFAEPLWGTTIDVPAAAAADVRGGKKDRSRSTIDRIYRRSGTDENRNASHRIEATDVIFGTGWNDSTLYLTYGCCGDIQYTVRSERTAR